MIHTKLMHRLSGWLLINYHYPNMHKTRVRVPEALWDGTTLRMIGGSESETIRDQMFVILSLSPHPLPIAPASIFSPVP
jgi:hypothetical protein